MEKNNLQKLIKQSKPFLTEYIKAEVGLYFTCGIVNSTFQDILKPYNLTVTQYNVLRILRGLHPEPANINLLKERMLDKMSDISRVVERLKNQGLVEKYPNELDKRNTDVFITEKAIQIIKPLDEVVFHKKNILNNLDENEIQQFNALIDKALSNLMVKN